MFWETLPSPATGTLSSPPVDDSASLVLQVRLTAEGNLGLPSARGRGFGATLLQTAPIL